MGSRSVCFSFTPGENEQLETVITIPEEHRSIIHGIVKNHCNKPVKDAVVKLYEKVVHCDEQILKPLTHTFTDECGQFVFGPLWPCRNYVIKVWLNDVKIREIVIHPEDCHCPKEPDKPCHPCNKDDHEKDEHDKEDHDKKDHDKKDCDKKDCDKKDCDEKPVYNPKEDPLEEALHNEKADPFKVFDNIVKAVKKQSIDSFDNSVEVEVDLSEEVVEDVTVDNLDE